MSSHVKVVGQVKVIFRGFKRHIRLKKYDFVLGIEGSGFIS